MLSSLELRSSRNRRSTCSRCQHIPEWSQEPVANARRWPGVGPRSRREDQETIGALRKGTERCRGINLNCSRTTAHGLSPLRTSRRWLLSVKPMKTLAGMASSGFQWRGPPSAKSRLAVEAMKVAQPRLAREIGVARGVNSCRQRLPAQPLCRGRWRIRTAFPDLLARRACSWWQDGPLREQESLDWSKSGLLPEALIARTIWPAGFFPCCSL